MHTWDLFRFFLLCRNQPFRKLKEGTGIGWRWGNGSYSSGLAPRSMAVDRSSAAWGCKGACPLGLPFPTGGERGHPRNFHASLKKLEGVSTELFLITGQFFSRTSVRELRINRGTVKDRSYARSFVTMEFAEIVMSRYATKKFDGRKIPEVKINDLIEMIRFAPSALNLQPWKIRVVTDQEVKEQLKPAAFNQEQVTESFASPCFLC